MNRLGKALKYAIVSGLIILSGMAVELSLESVVERNSSDVLVLEDQIVVAQRSADLTEIPIEELVINEGGEEIGYLYRLKQNAVNSNEEVKLALIQNGFEIRVVKDIYALDQSIRDRQSGSMEQEIMRNGGIVLDQETIWCDQNVTVEALMAYLAQLLA